MFTWKGFKKLARRSPYLKGKIRAKGLEVVYKRYKELRSCHGDQISKVYLSFFLVGKCVLEADSHDAAVNEIKQSCERFWGHPFNEVTSESLAKAFPGAFGAVQKKVEAGEGTRWHLRF